MEGEALESTGGRESVLLGIAWFFATSASIVGQRDSWFADRARLTKSIELFRADGNQTHSYLRCKIPESDQLTGRVTKEFETFLQKHACGPALLAKLREKYRSPKTLPRKSEISFPNRYCSVWKIRAFLNIVRSDFSANQVT
jgi:hypothetical protein